MDDLIIYLIIAVLAFLAGWRGREMFAQIIVAKYLKELDQGQYSVDDANIINVEIEKHEDVFYLYNTDNSAFITQVKSKEEMTEFFKKNYSDCTIMIKKEHFALFEIS